MKKLSSIIGVVYIVFTFVPVLSQNGSYRYFDINTIASKELIKSISKDTDGFIWLATDQGVLRYDGVETRLFYKELPTPYTKSFVRLKTGSFLVIHDEGLKEIINNPDTTYFKPFLMNESGSEPVLNYPKSIYEDTKGNLWIGEANTIVRINGNGFKRFALGDAYLSINYHRAFSFAEDAFGNLWIAPFKGKLLSYNSNLDSLLPVNLNYPITNATTIISVKGDHLLIGGREGILKLKVDSDKNISLLEFITDLQDISAAISINEQEIYFGTWTNGLYQLDFSNNRSKRVALPFNDILSFEYDELNQELWVTGSENVGLFKKVEISPIDEVGQTRIETVDVHNESIYYSVGEQMFKLTERNGTFIKELVLSSTETYYDRILIEDHIIWIGDAFGRIYSYDQQKKSLKLFQDVSGASIKHIYKDSEGAKWFSGNSTAVTRIDKEQRHRYFNVRNSSVIKESATGAIICGVLGNDVILYNYDKARDDFMPMRLEFLFEKTESILVEDFEFDNNNNIFLATDAGLLKVIYEEGAYKKVERVSIDGFDDNEPIRAIAIFEDIIWIANSYGLAVYRDGNAILYTTENGLPSKILKERGLSIDKKNNLLIATAKGLARVDVGFNKFRNASNPIFKLLEINGKKHRFTDNNNVFPYNSRMQAEFVALFYPGSDIVYQTRILGLDETWSKPSSNHNVSILSFPQGSYTLEVRARDGGFQWSEPLRFSFEVAYPWFRTWWAYIMFLSLLTLFTYFSVQIYNKNLIRQKKKLQKVIESRTEEINRQKNEIIEQKNKIIKQKEELLEKNKVVYESQHALSEADLKFLHLKEKQLQDQIEFKNKQITTHTLNILQKNTTLKDLRNKLEEIIKSPNGVPQNELKKSLRIIDESFKLDKDWEDFKLYFEQVYTGFYSKLKINYPDLSTLEMRHCALIRLNLNISECASILGISPESIKVSRTRLRKKLHIPNNGSLSDFILGI